MGRIKITLSEVMAEKNITNRDLAEKLGITEVHVSRLKHENVKAFRLDTLYSLCEVLECEPKDLLKKIE